MTTYIVSAGQTLSGVTVSAGDNLTVLSGGTATGIRLFGGTEVVSSGGTTSLTLVRSGGTLVVDSGATATATAVTLGGVEQVAGGRDLRGSVGTSGTVLVSGGGLVSGMNVGSGGRLEVFSGGTTSSASVSAGGGELVFSGGTASDTQLSGGVVMSAPGARIVHVVQFVSSGVVLANPNSVGVVFFGSSVTVSSGGTEYVLSRGFVSNTTVASGGQQIVYSGGSAFTTVVSNGGTEIVSGGNTSNTLLLLGGGEYISSGGVSFRTSAQSGGFEVVSNGGTAVSTTVNGGLSDLKVTSGGTASSTFVSSGLVELFGGTASGTTLTSHGTLQVDSGGIASDTIIKGNFSSETVFDGGTSVDAVVSNGGTELVEGGSISGAIVNSGGIEILAEGTATLTDLKIGGTIEVGSLPFASGGKVHLGANDVLTVSEGGHTYSQTLSGDYGGLHFHLAPGGGIFGGTDIYVDAVCFMAGTRIATPTGLRPVEELDRGDLVLTAEGGSAPVLWIGRQTVAATFADPMRDWPVRIKAGAFAENLPVRDLLVSPCHAVFIGGVLVQAGALVNGLSIVREKSVPPFFVYYHVELQDHALILAEGVAAETFVDNVDRRAFDNWAEHQALFGDDRPVVEMDYPRAKAHRQVPRDVRSLLATRLHLFVGDATSAA